MSHLVKFSHCRDMRTPPLKPVCAKYERGECSGLRCPYFHPKDLPTSQPAQQKTTPAAVTKQLWKPTLNPTEPTETTFGLPQSPKDDTNSAVVSCSVAISGDITKDDTESGPTQEVPSISFTSGTSPRKNGKSKKVQEDVKQYVCRNYLHKKCSQDPCPRYHDPDLADEPPLCRSLYEGPCTRNVCDFYHPERNRNRMVCRNFLNSRCDHKNCRRYHFRLPGGGEITPVSRESSVLNGGDQQPVTPSTDRTSFSSTSPTDVDLHRLQCTAWNDGYCPEGKGCKMLHLNRVSRWRMEAEQAAAKTIDRVIFDNTKVVFGAGCEIKQVITALESCRVLISNLPARTTKETLEDFLIRSGSNHEAFYILILRMSVDRETREASVIFNDARDAKTVVEALDKKRHFGEVLKFELVPTVTAGQMDDWTYNRSSYLEITFNTPSKQVQAIYPTVQDAIDKAKALNCHECWGRTVRVTIARPPKPHESWTYIKNSITISNVAIDTPESEILRFAKPFSMKTFGHKFFRVDAALRELEDHIRTVGDLKPGDFDVVRNSQKGIIFARGRFDTWEQADRVWQSLQKTQLKFLVQDHARIFLAFPHQYSLHVPLDHYDAQKEIYDRLESQHGRDRTAHIVATRYRTACLIQVVGIDKKAVGALKLKVEKIAQGEVVEVWDRFFLDWQGEAFFGRLLRQFKAYVRPDKTKQVLRVYGSETAINHARREIEKQMETLALIDFQMEIEDHCIRFFIQKGIKILGDTLGEDNVWLHTTSKPYFVSVRGGHDAEHGLQKLVSEASKRPLRPPVLDWSQTCPLCSEEPTQPFPLACQHIYCTWCLTHMLISATDGKSIPVCCIGDEGRCETPIPLPIIERFISPVRLTQMLENSFRVYLEQHPDEFRFCPTPDCTQIYRVSTEDSAVIQCPACLTETCSHCHKSPHRGLTCGPPTRP